MTRSPETSINRPLRIAVDGRELFGKPTGVGRYVREVLRQWATAPHQFTIVAPAEPTADLQALGSRFQWWTEAAGGRGTRWEQTRLPRALAKIAPDVFLAPAYTAPFQLSCPFVVVVYDVSFHAHPEWFGRREGWRRRWLTRSAARRARSVVTISEFSRHEILRHLKVPAAKIVIAPPGGPAASPTRDSVRPPVVLYVGSLFNRRRIKELMEAFARTLVTVPEARLVLAGDNRTSPHLDPRQFASDLGITDRFEWREYVDDNELTALYSNARVFAFLSDYEGFGMTPLEALAHGVPPVVLDTAVSREVYGDAAVFAQPTAESISASITGLLTDASARARIVAAGEGRLRTFQWSNTARVLLKALEDAAQ